MAAGYQRREAEQESGQEDRSVNESLTQFTLRNRERHNEPAELTTVSVVLLPAMNIR